MTVDKSGDEPFSIDHPNSLKMTWTEISPHLFANKTSLLNLIEKNNKTNKKENGGKRCGIAAGYLEKLSGVGQIELRKCLCRERGYTRRERLNAYVR